MYVHMYRVCTVPLLRTYCKLPSQYEPSLASCSSVRAVHIFPILEGGPGSGSGCYYQAGLLISAVWLYSIQSCRHERDLFIDGAFLPIQHHTCRYIFIRTQKALLYSEDQKLSSTITVYSSFYPCMYVLVKSPPVVLQPYRSHYADNPPKGYVLQIRDDALISFVNRISLSHVHTYQYVLNGYLHTQYYTVQ